MNDEPTKQDGDAPRGRRATMNTPEMVDLACRLWGLATKGQIKRAIRGRTGASARTCERIFRLARERLAEEGNEPGGRLDADMLASLPRLRRRRETEQPNRPDRTGAAAVPTVAAAVVELRHVAEAIGLAALDDDTLAALAELLTEAEATASRWLTARDPHLAGQDKQRRRRAQRTT